MEGVRAYSLPCSPVRKSAFARLVEGYYSDQLTLNSAAWPGGERGCVQSVSWMPFTSRRRVGGVLCPFGDTVLCQLGTVAVRDETQSVPVLTHRQTLLPRTAWADPPGQQRLCPAVTCYGRNDEVAVGPHQVHQCAPETEAIDNSIGDSLECVGQRSSGIEISNCHIAQKRLRPGQLRDGRGRFRWDERRVANEWNLTETVTAQPVGPWPFAGRQARAEPGEDSVEVKKGWPTRYTISQHSDQLSGECGERFARR